MKTSDFYYDLPEELIAQDPLEDRASSRLMILDKETGQIRHSVFHDIVRYLKKGDCLVINDTKVIPARLIGHRENTGGHVEILLLKRLSDSTWETLVKPGKKARTGDVIVFGDGILKGTITEVLPDGNRHVRFTYDGIFEEILDKLGQMPLPPYITHELKDRDRYNTVYARYEGSAAAPTAGLHFTKELLEQIKAMGVKIVHVTLHVGLGTFRPVKSENVEDHQMHTETFRVTEEAANEINAARASGGRIICVGTTSLRTVESAADDNGIVHPMTTDTGIFIYPGYKFRCLDCLITNFHLPESTLIMLVSALAGREHILNAYKTAVDEKYRFFSFGDAMFITDHIEPFNNGGLDNNAAVSSDASADDAHTSLPSGPKDDKKSFRRDKSLLFLYNPVSGRENMRTHLAQIIKTFSDEGFVVTVIPTKARPDTEEIVRNLGPGYDLIVASGGDGTMNELAGGLMKLPLEKRPPCGYIPTGTVNDFATSLRIPKTAVKAAEMIMQQNYFSCDIGSINSHMFSYVVGFGAFTEVSYQTSRDLKKTFGKFAYFMEAMKHVTNIKSHHMVIEHDGEREEGDFMLGLISNSKSIASIKAYSSKDIALDDGLLEAFFIRKLENPVEIQDTLSAIISRNFDTATVYSFKSSLMTIKSDDEIEWTIDGEDGGSRREAVIRNYQQAIRIAVPDKRKKS
jgi:S-adenosylmethionine:tRNA ribosyltransferase-isomerase